MSITCPHCATVLMGEVNRCWNCGSTIPASLLSPPTSGADRQIGFAEDSGNTDVEHANSRVLSEGGELVAEKVSAIADQPIDLSSPRETSNEVRGTAEENLAASGRAAFESALFDEIPGSPFAEPAVGKFLAKPPTAVYPQNIANVAGAALALLLGILALLEAAFFPLGALCTAIVGLMCGVWGIQSNRRVMSTIGMMLCTAALLWSSLAFAIETYIDQTGVNPLLPNTEVEPVEDDDFRKF